MGASSAIPSATSDWGVGTSKIVSSRSPWPRTSRSSLQAPSVWWPGYVSCSASRSSSTAEIGRSTFTAIPLRRSPRYSQKASQGTSRTMSTSTPSPSGSSTRLRVNARASSMTATTVRSTLRPGGESNLPTAPCACASEPLPGSSSPSRRARPRRRSRPSKSAGRRNNPRPRRRTGSTRLRGRRHRYLGPRPDPAASRLRARPAAPPRRRRATAGRPAPRRRQRPRVPAGRSRHRRSRRRGGRLKAQPKVALGDGEGHARAGIPRWLIGNSGTAGWWPRHGVRPPPRPCQGNLPWPPPTTQPRLVWTIPDRTPITDQPSRRCASGRTSAGFRPGRRSRIPACRSPCPPRG